MPVGRLRTEAGDRPLPGRLVGMGHDREVADDAQPRLPAGRRPRPRPEGHRTRAGARQHGPSAMCRLHGRPRRRVEEQGRDQVGVATGEGDEVAVGEDGGEGWIRGRCLVDDPDGGQRDGQVAVRGDAFERRDATCGREVRAAARRRGGDHGHADRRIRTATATGTTEGLLGQLQHRRDGGLVARKELAAAVQDHRAAHGVDPGSGGTPTSGGVTFFIGGRVGVRLGPLSRPVVGRPLPPSTRRMTSGAGMNGAT